MPKGSKKRKAGKVTPVSVSRARGRHGQNVDQQILQLLTQGDESMQAKTIAETLGMTTKQINPTIYRLQREGQLQRVSNPPPVWALSGSDQKTIIPTSGADVSASSEDGVELESVGSSDNGVSIGRGRGWFRERAGQSRRPGGTGDGGREGDRETESGSGQERAMWDEEDDLDDEEEDVSRPSSSVVHVIQPLTNEALKPEGRSSPVSDSDADEPVVIPPFDFGKTFLPGISQDVKRDDGVGQVAPALIVDGDSGALQEDCSEDVTDDESDGGLAPRRYGSASPDGKRWRRATTPVWDGDEDDDDDMPPHRGNPGRDLTRRPPAPPPPQQTAVFGTLGGARAHNNGSEPFGGFTIGTGVARGRGRGRGRGTYLGDDGGTGVRPGAGQQAMVTRICGMMSAPRAPTTWSTLDISHKLGLKTKSDVNSALYDMRAKGLLIKVKNQPPKWELTEQGCKLARPWKTEAAPPPRAPQGGHYQDVRRSTQSMPPSPGALLRMEGGSRGARGVASAPVVPSTSRAPGSYWAPPQSRAGWGDGAPPSRRAPSSYGTEGAADRPGASVMCDPYGQPGDGSAAMSDDEEDRSRSRRDGIAGTSSGSRGRGRGRGRGFVTTVLSQVGTGTRASTPPPADVQDDAAVTEEAAMEEDSAGPTIVPPSWSVQPLGVAGHVAGMGVRLAGPRNVSAICCKPPLSPADLLKTSPTFGSSISVTGSAGSGQGSGYGTPHTPAETDNRHHSLGAIFSRQGELQSRPSTSSDNKPRQVNTPGQGAELQAVTSRGPSSLLGPQPSDFTAPQPWAPPPPSLAPGGPLSLGSDIFAAINKNPVSALMELAQAQKTTATLEVLGSSGPPHKPTFRIAASLGSRQFGVVECSNKKEGRTEAADLALRTLMAEGVHVPGGRPDQPAATTSRGPSSLMGPQTSDFTAPQTSDFTAPQPWAPPPASLAPGGPLSLGSDTFAAINKNPVSALMEFAQARKTTATLEVLGASGPPHKPTFRIAAFVGSRQFGVVECSNKKDGRVEAADLALRTLMSEGAYQVDTSAPTGGSAGLDITRVGSGATHFDRVAGLSHQLYNTLAAQVAENMSGRKVLAAMVMQRGEGDLGAVISLGTGNRCITGQFLSLEGQTVNDSHAEVITRRGFMRFLYTELEMFCAGNKNSILQSSAGGKLKVKEDVTFHLYISTAPCGDGALFSPRDVYSTLTDTDNQVEHHPAFTSKVQGILRTKMEGGEGTIPIESDFTQQTWDGILRGERLRTMSCSDKVCRWNILGLQGALLSNFLEPIYLDSLTLGLLYDPGHLARAVCCRLSHGLPDITGDLPPLHRVNHPRLGRVTCYDPPRETQKTKEFSVNWALGDDAPEMTDGTKGICVGVRTLDAQVSRAAKCKLYDSFKSVSSKLGRKDLLSASTYGAAKVKAADYQAAKVAMLKKFKASGYGKWVGKPVEEKMFS